uniref:Nitronate monooxygenase n=1 Tax=Janibacter limosus TaxID=53458 RepID=A0AC61U3K3_9MICO|nr:nitronate monooxygenase [Janibacter limosus]
MHGVNFVVHRTNKRIEADLEKIVEHKVPLVITSLGAAKDVVDAVHSYGGLVFHDVVNAPFAAKAAQAGVDGLILVSAGSGGHSGGLNPFALIAEVRKVWDGPLILGGALSTGRDVLAAQAAGADPAYMGTRFLATEESIVSEEYRRMIVESGADEIVYTPSISTIPANFLRGSIIGAGLDPRQPPDPGAHRRLPRDQPAHRGGAAQHLLDDRAQGPARRVERGPLRRGHRRGPAGGPARRPARGRVHPGEGGAARRHRRVSPFRPSPRPRPRHLHSPALALAGGWRYTRGRIVGEPASTRGTPRPRGCPRR